MSLRDAGRGDKGVRPQGRVGETGVWAVQELQDPTLPALPTDLLPQALHRVPQHQALLQAPGRLP